MAFSLLIAVKYSLIMDIETIGSSSRSLVIPIAVVIGITLYPYAWENGLGKILWLLPLPNFIYSRDYGIAIISALWRKILIS